tara:strand:- start:309 stop:941 length:633 start_codon:yes stop_codon:yes gene_type:complete
MLIRTTKSEIYEIPYRYENEYGKKTIGVFGDSFAGLAKDAKYLYDTFTHESSWIYYLGVLSNSSIDAWGVTGGSENDLAFILQKNELNYDYSLLIHTNPLRDVRITKNKITDLYKALAIIEGKTRDKKNVLHVFWNVEHEIYKFSHKKYFMDSILKNHPNPVEVGVNVTTRNSTVNKNDQLGGSCHLSNRGNLLLAIEINKHLFSNDESI